MPRTDRIFSLLSFLRSRELTTVAEIAHELRVSERTVIRDVGLLREQGWPVDAESGPGGGLRLRRERGVTAVHLAFDEVAALWLAAKISLSVARSPFSKATRSALEKVLASLPVERRKALERLFARIVVGRPASARIRDELGTPPAELLTVFERGFTQGTCLEFDYVDRFGKASRRLVEPHGLLIEAPAWYLLTRDTTSGNVRSFRMDRIRSARLAHSAAFHPDFEGIRRQYLAERSARVHA